MGHWVVACIDLQHLHILTSNPSLKGSLDNVLLVGSGLESDACVSLCKIFGHCLHFMEPFPF